jgi:hypothetical protein
MVEWKHIQCNLLPSKRALWTAFATSMLCALFIFERHAGLHTSSLKPTGLYTPAIDMFGNQNNGPQDQRAEYDDVVPLGTLPDQFVRERTVSTTMLAMLPSKSTKRPQARLKQASPSVPAYPAAWPLLSCCWPLLGRCFDFVHVGGDHSLAAVVLLFLCGSCFAAT